MYHSFLLKYHFFGVILPTYVLHTLMCLKYISKLFTVKNPPWKKRDILLRPCLDNMAPR